MTVSKIDKKRRVQVMCRIAYLMDHHCETCPKNERSTTSVNRYCEEKCKVGEEIKNLGYELGREREKPKLTVEQYLKFKKEGKGDKDIEKIMGITHWTLYRFKKKNGLSFKRGENLKCRTSKKTK